MDEVINAEVWKRKVHSVDASLRQALNQAGAAKSHRKGPARDGKQPALGTSGSMPVLKGHQLPAR